MPSVSLRESLPDHAATIAGSGGSSWPTLLVVDDDPAMLQTLVLYFEKRGFHVAAAASVTEAKERFQRRMHWTLVISDYHLPDGTGWELCCWIRERLAAAPPFLLLSGGVNCAVLCPGTDFLAKPFRVEELENRVRAILSPR